VEDAHQQAVLPEAPHQRTDRTPHSTRGQAARRPRTPREDHTHRNLQRKGGIIVTHATGKVLSEPGKK